jgi:hypothetical protein
VNVEPLDWEDEARTVGLAVALVEDALTDPLVEMCDETLACDVEDERLLTEVADDETWLLVTEMLLLEMLVKVVPLDAAGLEEASEEAELEDCSTTIVEAEEEALLLETTVT